MKADNLNEANLPQKGIVLVKASTLRALVKRARRPIKGTQGQIDVKTTEEEVTISISKAAGGGNILQVIAMSNGTPVYVDISGNITGPV